MAFMVINQNIMTLIKFHNNVHQYVGAPTCSACDRYNDCKTRETKRSTAFWLLLRLIWSWELATWGIFLSYRGGKQWSGITWPVHRYNSQQKLNYLFLCKNCTSACQICILDKWRCRLQEYTELIKYFEIDEIFYSSNQSQSSQSTRSILKKPRNCKKY